MPIQNGIIYIDTSTTPDTGISIGDLQTALSVSSENAIGAIVQYAATHDTMKIWAKYKAERSNKLGILTESERQDNMYGLDIPTCSQAANLSTFVANYDALVGVTYTYLYPRGGGQTPKEFFRFHDFNGYNTNANCFVNTFDKTTPASYTVGQGGTGAFFHIGFNAGNNLHTNSIGITDLKLGGSSGTAFGNLYLGLIFKNGSSYLLVTSSSTLSTDVGNHGGGEITIPENSAHDALQGLSVATSYTVYPVLSVNSHSIPSSFTQQDEVVALPLLPSFSFIVNRPSTQQNLAFRQDSTVPTPYAYVGPRGRLNVEFILVMSGTPTSMQANYEIYSASYDGDTSGSQLATGSVNIDTSTPGSVSRELNVTVPTFVRLHAYNANSPTVVSNPDVWVEVDQDPDI